METNYSLRLIAANPEMSVDVPLYEEDPQVNLNKILIEKQLKVFSDIRYKCAISIPWEGNNCVINKLLVNGDAAIYTQNLSDNGIVYIEFWDKSKYIFLDSYGFVQIVVEILIDEHNSYQLYSDYLSVYLLDTPQNESIRKMAEYVYTNHDKFLYDIKNKPDNKSGLKNYRDYRSLESQRKLIENIIKKYTLCLPYFKNNAKPKIINVGKEDDISKLSGITKETLRFMSQHPEELALTKNNTGVKFGHSYYQPRKTFIMDRQLSYDIYENRVVVGFLYYLDKRLTVIIEDINTLLNEISEKEVVAYRYVSSVQYIYKGTVDRLNSEKIKLLSFHKEIKRLYLAYKEIFPINNEPMTHIPKYTNIFATLEQYNHIYIVIADWFKMGDYDLHKEEFMLPFLVNHKLYEYYVLFKILNSIKRNGYEYEEKKSVAFKYDLLPNSYYRNTEYNNTFFFIDGDSKITVYYQPVIYAQNYPVGFEDGLNGLALYRNTSISISDDGDDLVVSKKAYYTPDYIIKITEKNDSIYIILDAKYAAYKNTATRYLSNLVFKYLYSVSLFKENDNIAGLCAVYGKDIEMDKNVTSVKDVAAILGKEEKRPFSHLMRLTEDGSTEDFHLQMIWDYIKKVTS